MTMEVTNIDHKVVRYDEKPVMRDDVLTFSEADTFVAGTILARDSTTGKLVPYVKGGSTNENGIPKAVLTYEVTKGEAGDKAVRVLVAGTVKKQRLVIDADADDSNVDDVVLDELRDYGIAAIDVEQLSKLDNQ